MISPTTWWVATVGHETHHDVPIREDAAYLSPHHQNVAYIGFPHREAPLRTVENSINAIGCGVIHRDEPGSAEAVRHTYLLADTAR